MTAATGMTSWTWSQPSIRRRHVRYWTNIFGLAFADSLSFGLSYALFRRGASMPLLVLFYQNNPGKPSNVVDLFLLLSILFIAIRYISGDYARRQLFWDGAKVTTIALLITCLPDFCMLLVGRGIYAALPMALSWLALLFVVPIMRQGARLLMAEIGVWQIPTALIGGGPKSAEVCGALRQSLALGFDVRWLVIENAELARADELMSLKAFHSADAGGTAEMICSEGCKQAVITTEDMQSAHCAEVAQRLLEVNVPVAIVPAINRLPLANASINYFFGRDILLMQVRSNVQRLPSRFAKRLFDISTSLILLIALAPLLFIVAAAIKKTSAGPVTYSQVRVGRHGKPFRCIKFRTMHQHADAVLRDWSKDNPGLYQQYLRTYKLKDDPRITSIGRWLRRTSLDELPQLWNVLRGDMSLVGPRPVVSMELEEHYGPAAQLYMRTRPGMTGLWQVSGRSDTSYERRVFLDEWYILNWSFWYDIVILIQTVWIVSTGKGAF